MGGSDAPDPAVQAVLSPAQREFVDQFLLPLIQGNIEQGFNFEGQLVPGASPLQEGVFARGGAGITDPFSSPLIGDARGAISQLLTGSPVDVASPEERLAFFNANIADPTRTQAGLPGGLLDQVAARFGSRGPSGVTVGQGQQALANLELDLARQAGSFAAAGFDDQTRALLQGQQLQGQAVGQAGSLAGAISSAFQNRGVFEASLGAEQRGIEGEQLQSDFQRFLMNNFTVLSPVFQAALGVTPTALTPASFIG